VILTIPMAVSFLIALGLGQVPLLKTGAGSAPIEHVARFVVVALLAMMGYWLTTRAARRFLSLAVLLELNLIFPAEAPTRYSVALRSGTTRSLEDVVASPNSDETESAAALRVLELVAVLNHHDRLTRGHSERVRAYCDLLTEEMKLSADDANKLRWAGLLHDVGKIFVPEDILNKPDKPTLAEWEILRAHPGWGAEIVAPLAGWLGDWSLAVRSHHERWDGKGYPDRLEAEQIPLGARIVAVADAFDVMTSHRSYRRPRSHADARAELVECQGSQFDPDVVRAFLAISLGRLRTATGLLSAPASFLGINPASTAGSAIAPTLGSVVIATGASVAVLVGSFLGGAPRYEAPTIGQRAAVGTPETTIGPPRVLPAAPQLIANQRFTVAPSSVTTIAVSERPRSGLISSASRSSKGVVRDKGSGRISYGAPANFIGEETLTVKVCDGESCSVTTVTVVVAPVVATTDGSTTASDSSTTTPDGSESSAEGQGESAGAPTAEATVAANVEQRTTIAQPTSSGAAGPQSEKPTGVTGPVPAPAQRIPTPQPAATPPPGGRPTTTTGTAPTFSLEAVDDSDSFLGSTAFTIDVLANDAAFAKAELVVTGIVAGQEPRFGTAAPDDDGTHVVYRPEPGFSGVDWFRYEVKNNSGATASAEVTVTILSSSDPELAMMVHSGPTDDGNPSYHFSTLKPDSHILIQPTTDVLEVRWYVDNPRRTGGPAAVRTEAPFRLFGSDLSGGPVDLGGSGLTPGDHVVTAEIVTKTGTTLRNQTFSF